MVISKTIRNNKRFLKEPENIDIKPFRGNLVIRGQPAPVQELVIDYTRKHPNCTMNDYYKLLPYKDQGGVRNMIRIMVMNRRIKQRFTVD